MFIVHAGSQNPDDWAVVTAQLCVDGKGYDVDFIATMESDLEAALVREHVRTAMRQKLADIREAAYQRGLSDGRGHKPTITAFNVEWTPEFVGY